MSQLELALASGVSQRHISVLESGRAAPSRQIVLRLAEALSLPGRRRDELLLRSGYAPLVHGPPTSLPHPADSGVATDAALQRVLERQEPYPAVVLDGLGRIQMSNRAAQRLAALLSPKPIENLTLSVFDIDGLRPVIANWAQVAHQHLLRIRREAVLYSGTPEHAAFSVELDRLTSEPAATNLETVGLPDPTLVIDLRKGSISLQLLSMIVQFGAAYETALQELRIECFFPANDHSRRTLESLLSDTAAAKVRS